MFNIKAQLDAVNKEVVEAENRTLQSLLINDPGAKETLDFIMSDRDMRLAFRLVRKHNTGETRSGGKLEQPYVYHLLKIFQMLKKAKAGKDTLIASLFCESIENNRITIPEIKDKFSAAVIDILSKCNLDGEQDKYFTETILEDDYQIIRDIKLAYMISELQFVQNLRSYGVKQDAVKLIRNFDELKQNAVKYFDGWYSIGTSEPLQQEYESLMEQGHVEAFF